MSQAVTILRRGRYRCTLSGPTSTRTVTLDHAQRGPHPLRAGPVPSLARSEPRYSSLWIPPGRPRLASKQATSEELSFTQSQILSPRQRASDYGIAETLNPEVIQQIVDAFAKHTNTAALVIPADVVRHPD